MSLQELKAFVEPLSAEEKRALKALLQDEFVGEPTALPVDSWVAEHESAASAVMKAHPQVESPTDLSQTWKRTRRQQTQEHDES